MKKSSIIYFSKQGIQELGKEIMLFAKEEGLDLIEIAPNAKPPVVKIMNYGKFKYQQEKKKKEKLSKPPKKYSPNNATKL